jgi:NPCBM/NEW2 domain-containing protein
MSAPLATPQTAPSTARGSSIRPLSFVREHWKRLPRSCRLLLRALLFVAIVLLGVELSMRWLLFSSSSLALRWGGELREASFYADRWTHDDYWRLHQRFHHDPGPLRPEMFHPLLGWKSVNFDSQTFAHANRDQLGGRRPILLYGDSFAQCNVASDDCFEGLMERSELAGQYCLFNYGVRAYGLDQIYLLLTKSLDAWQGTQPIVVLGLYLDDDFDRSVLRYRGWPKPRFVLRGGALALERPTVPTAEESEREHPLSIASYFYRYLIYGTRLLPQRLRSILAGDEHAILEKQELNRALLEACREELERRGLTYFVLLFHGRESLQRIGPSDWRESFALRFLRERQVPYVSSKIALQEDALRTGRSLDSYFGNRGVIKDHLLPQGNEVVFGALCKGLRGEFDLRYEKPPPAVSSFQTLGTPDEQRMARWENSYNAPFTAPEDRERILIGVPKGSVTRIAWQLDGCCTSFRALARSMHGLKSGSRASSQPQESTPDASDGPQVGFSIDLDGRQVFGAVLSPATPDVPIEVDLRGVQRMTLSFDDGGDGGPLDLLYLASPRFE